MSEIDNTTDLVAVEEQTTAIVSPADAAMAKLMQADSLLDYQYEQMAAMSENNFGGSGGNGSSGYDFSGKVKVETNRNGTLTFTNPFTNKIEGAETIAIVPISVLFQLQRWVGEKEEIEGIDKEKQKGPLCRSIQFQEPVQKRDDNGRPLFGEDGHAIFDVNETGWFFQPAMSPYNARRMLPTLTGSNGCDGKQGHTLCSECPMSVQGYKGNIDGGKCSPTGMVECVIFKVGDEMLPQPVYAYIKMSVTSIIEYVKFLEQIEKVYKDPRTGGPLKSPVMRMIVALSCESMSSGGKAWGKLNFNAVGGVNPGTDQGKGILAGMATAIELTTAKVNEAKAKEAAKNGGGAPGKASGGAAAAGGAVVKSYF